MAEQTLDQMVATILHEEEPLWWNRLTDIQRTYYVSSPSVMLVHAFEAGIRAGLSFRNKDEIPSL